MRHHSLCVFSVMGLLAGGFHATYASAATRNPWDVNWSGQSSSTSTAQPAAWQVSFLDARGAEAPPPHLGASQEQSKQEAPNVRPKAFEYSHAYEVRLKIHVYASYATLPLFATELWLGQKLYNGGFSDAERTAHQWVAAGIAGLFVVNTVTGVMNLKEGWKDPEHHKLKLTHGILMLGADAGFVATGMLAPNRDGTSGNRGAHRAVAWTSIGVATASYLMMIFAR